MKKTTIFSYRPYWAKRYGIAPYLPMSRTEMEALGWDACDIIIVTGDAYVDHPSFGMAIVGRLLENQGFRVGIISQPDWTDKTAFQALGKPTLFYGVTAGNMDSMVNRYTAERRIRSDDAYTANGDPGKRPDRSVIVYAQRCREAFPDTPLIIGGIESSLRRIAHYDYWSNKIRRSILLDSKADLLVFGNGERQIVEIAHRLANRENIIDITDIRGTAFRYQKISAEHVLKDSTSFDTPGPITEPISPYLNSQQKCDLNSKNKAVNKTIKKSNVVIQLPSYDDVKKNAALYAHTSRILHLESNPGNARPLLQAHGQKEVWINPPPYPISTEEMDSIYELPYKRSPHPSYNGAKIPAYEMIKFSITIMRGCFGGCTFCSITEHEGRIIQSRSEDSIINEIKTIRDNVDGFTGNISDLGGPTANMYRLQCKSKTIETSCRRLSCVYPKICKNLNTDHTPLINLYRRSRKIEGVKRVFIASGLRYDLAVESPEYIKELTTHHVGGYLKIAPEHTQEGPLSKMMKPSIDSYTRFKKLFDRYSKQAGKEQYLIPYFIAAHPGTTDKDMLELAIWLKQNNYRADQVQAFLPTPMSIATAMYYSEKNPLHKVSPQSETVSIPRNGRTRRLHKALLRYHDANNWPLLREALTAMGRTDLIGNAKHHLVPNWQPKTHSQNDELGKLFKTQHVRYSKKQKP